MKKNLDAQHKELEDKRRVFEEERANWETQQRLQQQQMEATRYSTHTGAQIVYMHHHRVHTLWFSFMQSLCMHHTLQGWGINRLVGYVFSFS